MPPPRLFGTIDLIEKLSQIFEAFQIIYIVQNIKVLKMCNDGFDVTAVSFQLLNSMKREILCRLEFASLVTPARCPIQFH